MKKQEGFTLVELLVVVAILGVLMSTAVPLYRTWQQRAYGSEAAIMIKQLLDAQIIYFLDKDKFYPADERPIDIYHNTAPGDPEYADLEEIYKELNISIPTGHFLEYSFRTDPGGEKFYLTVQSLDGRFDIFKGTPSITGTIDKEGNTQYVGLPS